MKREIEFRGLRTDGQGWAYGYYWRDNSNGKHKITVDLSDDNFYCHEIDPETVGQYIGIKDLKAEKLYEGDIVDGHSDGFGVIEWSDFDGGYDYCFDDGASVGLWEVRDRLRKIGNIYEHKKSLK